MFRRQNVKDLIYRIDRYLIGPYILTRLIASLSAYFGIN